MQSTVGSKFQLAVQRHQAGDLSTAEALYREVLAERPQHPDALHLLGVLLAQRGDSAEAIRSMRAALRLKPGQPAFLNNLALACAAMQDFDAAVDCYQQVLAVQPQSADAWFGLGLVWQSLERLHDAEAAYRQAIQCRPDYADAFNNLGVVLQFQGKLLEAIQAYQQAVTLRPDFHVAAFQLLYQRQHICSWQELESQQAQLMQAISAAWSRGEQVLLPPFSVVGLLHPTTAQQQFQAARQWAASRLPRTESGMQAVRSARARQRSAEASVKPRRVRLGYLSADYRQHPVGLLSVELFELHDRDRFEVYGYSYGPDDGSGVRSRISGAFDVFRDVRGLSHVEAARQIADDGVDILVDLTGYTQHSRTEILAYRPAPLQVNYLGYPGTLGADFMDYILVDDYIVPPDQQAYFSERLVHLPVCYQANDSRLEISSETPGRAACGLPADGFVFCAFNNSYKITPAMFSVWMRLLQAVPGSVLWLLEANATVVRSLQQEAERRGVRSERLLFAPRVSSAQHLARHRHADLFLDTYPFNAHTTASDSLRMGVPLLTVSGDTFASRVAGSLLRAVGLSDLIAGDLSEYERQALSLALDGDRLSSVRSRLRAGIASSGIFGGGRIVRDLERAYSVMWEQHLSGAGPRGFRVSGSGGSAAEVHQ